MLDLLMAATGWQLKQTHVLNQPACLVLCQLLALALVEVDFLGTKSLFTRESNFALFSAFLSMEKLVLKQTH